jgi:hypothetical protein
MKDLAPIALFCHTRVDHLTKTIQALQRNDLANETNLVIYSDSWNAQSDKSRVLAVRSYLSTVTGFKSVEIINRDRNYGLKNSIISGITEILRKYPKVIVLEDDIETSKYFIRFMNEGLDRYLDDSKIWQISGWSYPIFKSGIAGSYFHQKMNCWGWATWKNRWEKFSNDSNSFGAILLSKKDRKKFNLMNSEISYQVAVGNYVGRKKTWAVLWHLCIFINAGLCFCPMHSHTKNIGMDNSGTNSRESNLSQLDCSDLIIEHYPIDVKEDERINILIIDYLKKHKLHSLRNKLKTIYFEVEFILFLMVFFYKKTIKRKFDIKLIDV